MIEYTKEDAIFDIENELALEYGIPTEKDLEIFASEALEAGDIENVFDFVDEATKKKMNKEQCMKEAKDRALEKFKKGRKYKAATKGLSKADRDKLDRKLRGELDRKERDAESVWERHPYCVTFLAVYFFGILGAFFASLYYLDKYVYSKRHQ